MFESVGKLIYREESLVLEVDSEIGRYYRSLLPKSWRFSEGRWPDHITVIRKGEGKEYLGGEEVEFLYSGEIKYDNEYIWLSCYCERLSQIRISVGLDLCFDKIKGFHITIANFKNLTK